MMNRRTFAPLAGLLLSVLLNAGCAMGPAASGSFDRTLNVSGPIRLELNNAAGDVSITGSSDGKVHVHGDARASSFGFESPDKRISDLLANPPVEQRGNTIHIGEEMRRMRNVSVTYMIEVPHDTEISSSILSGAQTIRDVRGPVKAEAASGSIRVSHIERQTQLSTLSGSIRADNIGEDIRANSASGTVTVSNIKGDVRISALSGSTQILKPGGRVEASTASGSVDVEGATSDVKAHAASGRVNVQGNPGTSSYWDLKTASGTVQLEVPANASFHLAAEAVSGEIKTDIPVVVEEQGKHSLRARVGSGNGGRVEVRTVSGEIRLRAS
jgi:Putative adhesin